MKLFLTTDTFIDTSEPLDLSISLKEKNNIRAWYVDSPEFDPVKNENYTGSVKDGGNVNFRDIIFRHIIYTCIILKIKLYITNLHYVFY